MKKEKWTQVDLPDGSYADSCRPFSSQDLVNYMKEAAEAPGTRSGFKLICPPGLKPWLSIGSGPCRGLHDAEGKRFGVLGNYLYEFSANGSTATQLGYVPGRTRVQMAHNQIAGGYEIAIANGSAGFIYNTVSGEFAKITDSSFSGGKTVTFIDQMFVWVDSQGRHFLPSDIADGLTYTALEEQQAEMSPDRIQMAIAAHQELVVLSKTTVQFFQSTGDPEELFADKKAGLDVGCASPHCVSVLDNTLFWVTDKGTGVRLNGGVAQRITTHAIEQEWAKCDLSKCFAYTWEDRGHAVYYVTFPVGEGNSGKTWGYDCATQRWHRRQTVGRDRWRVSCMVKWGSKWYAGAYNSGEIYELDWDYPLEGCDEIVSEFTTPVLADMGNRIDLHGIRIDVDTGHETVECVSVDPIIPSITDLGDIYVGLSGDVSVDALAIIDGPTDTLIDTVGATAEGYTPVISPDKTKVYFHGTDHLSQLVIATGVVTEFTNSDQAGSGILLNDAGTYAWAMTFSPKLLQRVNLSDGTVTDYTPNSEAAAMCWNADKTKIHFPFYTASRVGTLVVASGAISHVDITSRNQCRGCAFNTDNGLVYFTCTDPGDVSPHLLTWDPDTGLVGLEANLPAICGACAFVPDMSEIWVCNHDNAAGRVYVYSAALSLLHTITVGAKPNAITINEAGTRAYVTNGQDETVSVIDVASRTVVATVTMPSFPQGTAILEND